MQNCLDVRHPDPSGKWFDSIVRLISNKAQGMLLLAQILRLFVL